MDRRCLQDTRGTKANGTIGFCCCNAAEAELGRLHAKSDCLEKDAGRCAGTDAVLTGTDLLDPGEICLFLSVNQQSLSITIEEACKRNESNLILEDLLQKIHALFFPVSLIPVSSIKQNAAISNSNRGDSVFLSYEL